MDSFDRPVGASRAGTGQDLFGGCRIGPGPAHHRGRWCTDGKPYLFTGRIDADKPIKELTDVRKESGGWAKIYGNRIVMFSKTSRGQVDGLDLTIPQGRIVQIEFHIDGKEPTPEQIFLGEKGAHPKGVPLKIRLR